MYAFWEIIASNAIVATILAIGATLLSRIWKNAAAVHVLWVVVLLKLFTPPLVTTALPVAFTSLPSAARTDSNESRFHSPAHKKAEQTVPVAMTNPHGAIVGGQRPAHTLEHVHGDSRPQALVTLHHRSPLFGFAAPAARLWAMPSAFAVLQASSAIPRRHHQPSARWSPSFRAGWV